MLRIAICEDEPLELEVLSNFVNKYLADRKYKAEIKIYTDALSILADSLNFDIYLLDIVLPGDIDGIKLGRLIKSQDAAANIVYISADSAYAIEAYKVRALHYILKPVAQKELFEVLDYCYEQAKKNRCIIKTPAGQRKIITTDLVYINIGRRNLVYHLRDGSTLDGMTIRTNFEIEIGPLAQDVNFIFLRPSLLVNLSEVDLVYKNDITFKNGEKIRLSDPQMKEFKAAWTYGCIML